MVGEGFRNGGDFTWMGKHAKSHQYCHQQESYSKYGIHVAHNLIYGEYRHGQIEGKYDYCPQEIGSLDAHQLRCQLIHQAGRNQHPRELRLTRKREYFIHSTSPGLTKNPQFLYLDPVHPNTPKKPSRQDPNPI